MKYRQSFQIRTFWIICPFVISTCFSNENKTSITSIIASISNTEEIWTSCHVFFCESTIASLKNQCNATTNACSCDRFQDTGCSGLNSSAEFALFYSKRPRAAAIVRGIRLRSENLETLLNFSIRAVSILQGEIETLSFTHFCTIPTLASTPITFNTSKVSNLTKPLELFLANNCISNITGAFADSFPNLVVLDLSQNELKEISNDLLQNMSHLEVLNLTYNELASINTKTFEDLKSLQTLVLAANKISVVEEGAFDNLINLKILNLNDNLLMTLSESIFKNTVQLKAVLLGKNKLHSFSNGQFKKLAKLKLLYLSDNELTVISDDWLKGLESLAFLIVDNNNVNILKHDSLKELQQLDAVRLEGNNLTEIPNVSELKPFVSTFTALPSYYLAHNNISVMHLPLISRIRKSKNLDLSHNCFIRFVIHNEPAYSIRERRCDFFKCRYCCLTELKPELAVSVIRSLDLSHNHLTSLRTKDLAVFHQKILDSGLGFKVNLSYNRISTIEVDTKTFNQNRTSYLENFIIVLDHNPVICDCHLTAFVNYIKSDGSYKANDTFIEPPRMLQFRTNELYCESPLELRNKRVLELNGPELKCNLTANSGCPPECRCEIFHDDSVVINCTDVNLHDFPFLSEQLFQHADIQLVLSHNFIRTIPKLPDSYWTKISELNLSNNRLKSLRNLNVQNKLRAIYVDGNLFQKVEHPLTSMLRNNLTFRIQMANNPWKCDCDLLSVKYLLFNKKVVDSSIITCVLQDTNSREITILLSRASDRELCPSMFVISQMALNIAIPAGIVALLVTASFLLFHRYSAEIKLWLFTHRLCLQFVSEDEVDADKVYDAFVSYSSKDEDWVIDVLVHGLEHGNPSYRLCLHERDWPGGEWIPNQIARSVQHSRRTIIVLTDNFIDSYWSKMEFQTAYRQMMKDNMQRILVVVPDEVPPVEKLDDELRAFISINTYIRWDKPNFWRKMRCAMPRVRADESAHVLNPAFTNT